VAAVLGQGGDGREDPARIARADPPFVVEVDHFERFFF
jgi:hypothetical protein